MTRKKFDVKKALRDLAKTHTVERLHFRIADAVMTDDEKALLEKAAVEAVRREATYSGAIRAFVSAAKKVKKYGAFVG